VILRERICRCGHEEARHQLDGGKRTVCLHGCGCSKFHGGRARGRKLVSPPMGGLEEVRRTGYAFVDAIHTVLLWEMAHPPRTVTYPPSHAVGEVKAAGRRAAPATEVAGQNGAMNPCERAILTALVQRHPKPSTRAQIALLSGYSQTSGGFGQALASLRRRGFLGDSGGAYEVTPTGIAAAGEVEPIPSRLERVQFWSERLGPCAGAILNALYAAYPGSIGRETLAARTGYSPTSGGFGQALAKLRTLGLVEDMCASKELMED